MKEEMQAIAFQIIAQAGSAKSSFIEAISYAKEGNFDQAKDKIKEGEEIFSGAHKLHFDIVSKEAQGMDVPFSILFMHSEDQLLNTETIKIMADEFIYLYQNRLGE